MQIYKTFFKISRKYRTSIFIYSIVFLVLLFAMTKMGAQQNEERFQASAVSFSVIDEDKTLASEALLDYLSTKHNLVTLDHYDEESLQDHIYYEKIQYVLYIPKGYEEKLMAGDMENIIEHSMRTDSAKGYFFNQDINAYLDTLSLFLKGGFSMADALEKAQTVIDASSEDYVTQVSFEKTNSGNDKLGYFFQYLPYVMMGCLVVAIAPILIAFHKKDLSERLACSSTSLRKQNTSIGLACITYCLGYWLIMILIAGCAFGFGSILSTTGFFFIINSMIYTLFVIALVLLIGSFSINPGSLNLIANVIALGSSFLCGIFVPQWLLGKNVLMIARFLPAYWYIKNTNMLAGFTGEAVNVSSFWTNIGMQLLFVAAILSIYLVSSSQRRSKSLA